MKQTWYAKCGPDSKFGALPNLNIFFFIWASFGAKRSLDETKKKN
jgi:hypothetical protein